MNTRKYILCSSTCSAEEYRKVIPDDKDKTNQSIQKFYRVLCDGFVRNDKSIVVFSKRPTNLKKSGGRRYFPSKEDLVAGVHYHYTRLINIKGLDIFYSLFSSFFWFLNPCHCRKDDVVIIDPLNLAIGMGCLMACKLRGVRTLAFVTDLITHYTFGDMMPSSFVKYSYWVQTHTDGMIFVTEQMNEASNPKHKPYIVVEGFVDSNMAEKSVSPKEKYNNLVCLYSGGIEKHYGLDMLVEGFVKAGIPHSELHLYGPGHYVEEIIELAKAHPNIKYYGCKENAIVVKEQMKATLLVNPRYTDAEYTKYSFPGKNMEYMVSGTATLTTVLPGMPKEYYPHVFLLENETVEGMMLKLQEVFGKPKSEIEAFGKETKEWMLENKNNKKQVGKIILFVEESMIRNK